jgi:AsmA protein
VEGKAGPLNTADALLTPGSAHVAISRLNLVASGFIDQAAGLSGVIDWEGTFESDGSQVRGRGQAKGEKLQLVKGGSPTSRLILLKYVLSHRLKDQAGTLSEAQVEFGKAIAHLSGSYSIGDKESLIKMKLQGENMPAQDLEALLPAVGVTLPEGSTLQGGMLNANLAIEGPIEKLVTTGNVGIFNTRLTGFDLGSKMAAVASLTGIKPSSVTEIEKLTLDAQVKPEGIQADNLLLLVPALGQLTGSGTVSSDRNLNFKMLAKLSVSGGVMGGLSRLIGAKANKDLAVPFSIVGTTLNPKFVPDVKGTAKGLLDSVLSGQKTEDTTKSPSQPLGDTLRELFKKKN